MNLFARPASIIRPQRKLPTPMRWAAAKELARRYPLVRVDPDVLFVDEGQVLTSAGAVAGLDLCLHLIACDLGNAAAASAARLAVMPMRRDGGQAQFIIYDPPAADTELGALLGWMEDNAHRAPRLEEIAAHASTSVRTLSRQFKAFTGTTPAKWLLEARVRSARTLLETTELSVERIAVQAGFESSSSLRESFGRRLGTTPLAYRRALGATELSTSTEGDAVDVWPNRQRVPRRQDATALDHTFSAR